MQNQKLIYDFLRLIEHNHFDRLSKVNIDTGLSHTLNRHYEISGATGTLPFSEGWHQVYVMGGDDPGYTTQICTGLTVNNSLYFRHRINKIWNSWRTILDSNNFGDYAAAKSHTHPYLPLSGGTLTGALTIDFNHSGGGTTYSLFNVLFNGTHDFGIVAKFHSYGSDSPAIRFSHSSNKSEYNS